MQKAVPAGGKTVQGPERSAPARRTATSGPAAGNMAQLAAMANQSPRVQAQLKLADEINSSPQVAAQRRLAGQINAGPAAAQFRKDDKRLSAQTKLDDKRLKQPKMDDTAQAAKKDKLKQPKYADGAAQLAAASAPNKTGLPDNLKAGVESLSGVSLDSVKVHYNSPKPAQLNALAYAQGTDIHVAPGQQKHLPHEAWHVAQQSQGRVKPTTQTKGVSINDDSGLEREADVMGAKAATMQTKAETVQAMDKRKKK